MKFLDKRKEFPTPWKRRFAFFPVQVAQNREGVPLRIWLEPYEEQELSYTKIQRRPLKEVFGCQPIVLHVGGD
jgi:hypothetical protein